MTFKNNILSGLAALVIASTTSLSTDVHAQSSTPGTKNVSSTFDFLDRYDSKIDNGLKYFQDRGHTNLPPRNLIKAMIYVESGSVEHRNGAFVFDPMQIANKGDHALNQLQNKKENTFVIADFSFLNGKKNTPYRNGWDYSSSNMDADSSITGGIGWLIHKSAHYGHRITDEKLKSYKVKSGDNFEEIARKVGSSVDILKKCNPDIEPRRLQIDQTLYYQSSVPCIKSQRDWQDAVALYNGGGNKLYARKVYSAKAAIDRLDVRNFISSR